MRLLRLHPDRHGPRGHVFQPGPRRSDEPAPPDRRELLPPPAPPGETPRRPDVARRLLTAPEDRGRRPAHRHAPAPAQSPLQQPPAQGGGDVPAQRACAEVRRRGRRAPRRVLRAAERERVRPIRGDGGRPPRGAHAPQGQGEDGDVRGRDEQGQAGAARRVHVTGGITVDGGRRGGGQGRRRVRRDQEGTEAVQELQTVRGSEEVRGELFVQRGRGL